MHVIDHRPNRTGSEKIIDFCKKLSPAFAIPEDIEMMNPYQEQATMETVSRFYRKFYNDRNPRILLFGINPGRFGAGVTGIPFTDPIRLQDKCGIDNDFDKKPELSSEFVYEVVEAYGGAESFYGDFFVSAVCPLGFTRDGKNLNYYDDKTLLTNCEPFITHTLKDQLEMFPSSQICGCLGKGRNFDYFLKLNRKAKIFKKIIPLPHPRWVMQYRRRKMKVFIQLYVELLKKIAVKS